MAIKIDEKMQHLLLKQNVVVVGTVSPEGGPNLSLKGVVEVDPEGFIYFLDLYRGKTRGNLRKNSKVALTVFSIPEFQGYQFKGKAEFITKGPVFEKMVEKWKVKRRGMLSRRIVQNLRRGFSHGRSETRLPQPKYLVEVEVEKIYNLVPRQFRT